MRGWLSSTALRFEKVTSGMVSLIFGNDLAERGHLVIDRRDGGRATPRRGMRSEPLRRAR